VRHRCCLLARPPNLLKSTTLIERQCVRIERLVENLLALSRIRSGTLQLHPACVELGPIIEDVVNQARENLQHSQRPLSSDRRRPGSCDRERLVMMLRNVTDAAARASRPGRPVTVRLDRRGDYAEIAVAFYPDSANHSAETPQPDYEFDDLGVGRYVTATIVEAHGGTLTEEADETSTTIRIRLPLLVESASEQWRRRCAHRR
jgi:signal transduction histidine kinase